MNTRQHCVTISTIIDSLWNYILSIHRLILQFIYITELMSDLTSQILICTECSRILFKFLHWVKCDLTFLNITQWLLVYEWKLKNLLPQQLIHQQEVEACDNNPFRLPLLPFSFYDSDAHLFFEMRISTFHTCLKRSFISNFT